MTHLAFMQRAWKSAVRRIGFLFVAVLILSGCSKNAQLLAVKAVAAGAPSLAPFFDERSGLGHDAPIQVRQAPGGLQAGNTPGLYGGSRRPTVCEVKRLKEFLTDPQNSRKAVAWAQVQGIDKAGIADYLDRLTPVLLRHDTLVQNHDYKTGRATPFNSLLEAGIAVLVDDQGQPRVKCSCGNPLRPFQGDTTRISVKFEDGNKKWAGYDRASVVTVKPAPQRLSRLALVDVDDPDRGIDRPVGTTGGHDKPFDTRVRHKVPDVTGMRFAEAGRRLTDAGLAVLSAGKVAPPDEAVVTGSDPAPGTELAFGQYVTLSVDTGSVDTGGTSAPPSSGGTTPGKTSTYPATPSGSGTGFSPSASGGSSSPHGSARPPTSSSAPPATSPSTSRPPASGSAPGVTSSPPTGKPATGSAPVTRAPVTSTPATGAPSTGKPAKSTPATSKPATSEPATSKPATSAPANGGPPVTRARVTGSPTTGTTGTT